MSDPQTNPDIEDVLSSIRRLVSEHAKPAQTRRVEPADDDPGRLVLTPALRVAEDDAPGADGADEIDTSGPDADVDAARDAPQPGPHQADPDAAVAAEMTEGESVAEMFAADLDADTAPADGASDMDGQKAAEPEHDADAPGNGPLHLSDPVPPAADAEPDAEDDATPWQGHEAASDTSSAPESGDDETREIPSLEATIAELEAVINRSGETWDPEADEASIARGEAMPWEDWTGSEGDAPFEAPGSHAADTHRASTDTGSMDTDAAVAPEPSAAAVRHDGATEGDAASRTEPGETPEKTPEMTLAETAAGTGDAATQDDSTSREDAAPDGHDYDDGPPETLFPEDAAVLASVHALRETQDTDGFTERLGARSAADEDRFDFFGEDESILDEEALRDLVAEIVRKELQGALGERITRNVRKLVRREIHRALASQELD